MERPQWSGAPPVNARGPQSQRWSAPRLETLPFASSGSRNACSRGQFYCRQWRRQWSSRSRASSGAARRAAVYARGSQWQRWSAPRLEMLPFHRELLQSKRLQSGQFYCRHRWRCVGSGAPAVERRSRAPQSSAAQHARSETAHNHSAGLVMKCCPFADMRAAAVKRPQWSAGSQAPAVKRRQSSAGSQAPAVERPQWSARSGAPAVERPQSSKRP